VSSWTATTLRSVVAGHAIHWRTNHIRYQVMSWTSEENGTRSGGIDYKAILDPVRGFPTEGMIAFLFEHLPSVWRDAYLAMSRRQTDICSFWRGSFQFVFDDYATLEASGKVPYHPEFEARVVAALGRSTPTTQCRDDYRLRGWIGPTETYFGKRWDKGHFIAHSIGGEVDRSEVNVFVQRRDLNRGWSAAGKRFRTMEQYCSANPGTFCFNRPLYTDGSARPAMLEFGILTSDGDIWVELFDNR